MTPRDFIVTPSEWLTDPHINELHEDTELLFRRLCQATDKNWRFFYNPANRELSVRCAIFECRFRAWSQDRIKRCLNELTAVGILVPHFQADRHWFEVGARFQYKKGRDPFGISVEMPMQPDLPDLEPGLALLPPAEPARKSRAGKSAGNGGIPRRTESEQRTDTESESARTAEVREVRDSGTRMLGQGRNSETQFKRWIEDDPDNELWCDLCRAMGQLEMFHNGAMWLKRVKEHRKAVFIALTDYNAKSPAERERLPAGPWMTKAFRSEVQRAG